MSVEIEPEGVYFHLLGESTASSLWHLSNAERVTSALLSGEVSTMLDALGEREREILKLRLASTADGRRHFRKSALQSA